MWLISGGFPPSKRGPGVYMLKFQYFHHIVLKVSACLVQASGKGKSMGIMYAVCIFIRQVWKCYTVNPHLLFTRVYLQGHI